MIIPLFTTRLDPAAQHAIDGLAVLLRSVLDILQDSGWTAPPQQITGSQEYIDLETLTASPAGFVLAASDDLLARLEDIRNAVVEGYQADALTLIDQWIDTVSQAKREDVW